MSSIARRLRKQINSHNKQPWYIAEKRRRERQHLTVWMNWSPGQLTNSLGQSAFLQSAVIKDEVSSSTFHWGYKCNGVRLDEPFISVKEGTFFNVAHVHGSGAWERSVQIPANWCFV